MNPDTERLDWLYNNLFKVSRTRCIVFGGKVDTYEYEVIPGCGYVGAAPREDFRLAIDLAMAPESPVPPEEPRRAQAAAGADAKVYADIAAHYFGDVEDLIVSEHFFTGTDGYNGMHDRSGDFEGGWDAAPLPLKDIVFCLFVLKDARVVVGSAFAPDARDDPYYAARRAAVRSLKALCAV